MFNKNIGIKTWDREIGSGVFQH